MMSLVSNSTIWRCKKVDQGHATLAWRTYLRVAVVGKSQLIYIKPPILRNVKKKQKTKTRISEQK